jgi:hypothetical protein
MATADKAQIPLGTTESLNFIQFPLKRKKAQSHRHYLMISCIFSPRAHSSPPSVLYTPRKLNQMFSLSLSPSSIVIEAINLEVRACMAVPGNSILTDVTRNER